MYLYSSRCIVALYLYSCIAQCTGPKILLNLNVVVSGMQAVGYDNEEDIESALRNNHTLYSSTLAALVFDPVDLNQQR